MPSALIVGGAGRIGGATARRLAKHGYHVAITAHTSVAQAHDNAQRCRDMGVDARVYQCDVANPAAVTAMVDAVVRDMGIPDVVVCNAGIFPEPRPLAALDVDAVRHAFDVNTLPVVTLAVAYANHLQHVPGRTGRLISVSSLGAIEIWKDRLAYNVSKNALVTAVKSLARSGAPRLSVNTVAPGAIAFPDEPNGHEASLVPAERIPMGRYGTADDVVDAIWFFATCSPYITGQFLAVDGGYHLHR